MAFFGFFAACVALIFQMLIGLSAFWFESQRPSLDLGKAAFHAGRTDATARHVPCLAANAPRASRPFQRSWASAVFWLWNLAPKKWARFSWLTFWGGLGQ